MYLTCAPPALNWLWMHKTFASLLVTLAVSVMGIPVAYLVGQRSAEHDLANRLAEERARARAEQQALIEDLRDKVAPKPSAVQPAKTEAAPAAPKPSEKLAEAAPPPRPAPVAAPAPQTPPVAQATPASAKPAAPVLPAISKESFDALALGTTYAEIALKFGREGVPALTMEDEHGSLTRQYVWQWIGPKGKPARVTLRFVDGSLTEKSYSE